LEQHGFYTVNKALEIEMPAQYKCFPVPENPCCCSAKASIQKKCRKNAAWAAIHPA